MPSAYATKLAEGFSKKVIEFLYEYAPIDDFVNRDYEGEINAVGSKLNILTIQKLGEQFYTGANLSASNLQEVNGQLIISQFKSFYWMLKTLNQWQSYIKNPQGTVIQQAANERKKNIMLYLMTFYAKAAAGQWYGTNYTAGTVTIDVNGNVTGSGTTFTSAMVGLPFQAVGQTEWYRVATYVSATSITLIRDVDDDSQTYDGGVITGATYIIQANAPTAISSTGTTFLSMVLQLKQYLDKAEVPDEDRVLFIPPEGETTMLKDPGIKLNVPAAYEDLVVKGFITELVGFKVFKVNRLSGNNTSGYFVLAAQKNFLTFADKALEVGMEEDLIGNFGTAYKDLYVYGGKVVDARRPFGATAFVTFS